MSAGVSPTALALAAGAALLLCAGLLRLLRPVLARYALARPNARSSHTVPTPQGGGAAVLASALAVTGLGLWATGIAAPPLSASAIAFAALVLGALGATDDIRPLPAGPRFAIQLGCVALAIFVLGPARILPDSVPLVLERLLLVLAGTWWVNLVNFMDGIDWITVAEFVPLCGALVLFGIAGWLPPAEALLSAALGGAVLGFAPANRPVARLFLGDVGSLPLGLLSGVALLGLAGAGHLAAALILPLYYLADATGTLARRAARGERVWEAHRSHFYQRARDNGFTVGEIDGRVFALNLLLAGLAALTIIRPGMAVAALPAALVLVAALLARFARPR